MTPEGSDQRARLPLVILMHGFGASMYDLAGLASAIDAQGYAYAFPNAPYRLQLGPGVVGYSWMTGRPGVEAPPEGSPSVDELLDGFVAEVAETAQTQPGQMVLGGFSQGGGLTLSYGLPRPDEFPGLAVLSGVFRDPEAMRARLPEGRRQRLFLVHGRFDQVIPIDNGGRQTKAFLEAEGYPLVYREYDMAHEISPGVIRDLTAWLHETLPSTAKA
jgi:phospholipase/carboxylesterase